MSQGGISMVEVMVVATLSLLLAVLVTQAIQEGTQVARHQDRYRGRQEEIFHTVDTLRCDLARCGSYLQPLVREGRILPVMILPRGEGWVLLRGEYRSDLDSPLSAGASVLQLSWEPGAWRAGDRVLLSSPQGLDWEENRVLSVAGGEVVLEQPVSRRWPEGTRALKVTRIRYLWDPRTGRLSRGVNGGSQHTLMEEVSHFEVEVMVRPWSIRYCLECGCREQVQGLVLLSQLERVGSGA